MAYGNLLTDVVQSSTTNTPPVFKDGNGTETGQLCRAWVNFNGVSGSVGVRASFNVSSITRTGSGAYTLTFTNAMSDANYCIVGSHVGATQSYNNVGGIGSNGTAGDLAAASFKFTYQYHYSGYGLADQDYLHLAIFR